MAGDTPEYLTSVKTTVGIALSVGAIESTNAQITTNDSRKYRSSN